MSCCFLRYGNGIYTIKSEESTFLYDLTIISFGTVSFPLYVVEFGGTKNDWQSRN